MIADPARHEQVVGTPVLEFEVALGLGDLDLGARLERAHEARAAAAVVDILDRDPVGAVGGRSPTSEYERMSGSSSTTTAMSRWAPVGYGCACPAGSISIIRTSAATSRTARTGRGPEVRSRRFHRQDQRPRQAGIRRLAQHEVEVVARQPRVLARERLRARAFARFDRLEDPRCCAWAR